MATRTKERLFTSDFILISLIWMMIFCSYYVLTATLPVYVVKQLGGHEASIGLVTGVPGISTALLLPFFGRLSDKHGRKPVLLFGVLGLTITAPAYALANSVNLLLALRFVYGALWAAAIAATLAFLADIAPITRRGEAMGYSNIAANVGLAVGPPAAIAIINAYDFNALFAVLTGIATVGLILSLVIRESLNMQHITVAVTRPEVRTQPMRTLLFSPCIMLTSTIAYGTLLSFVPVYALSRGVENPGLFFTVLAVFLMLARASTGTISDKLGRRAVIIPGMGMAAVSLIILSTSATLPSILLVAAMWGFGFGATHSSLMALAADFADEASRGRAMAYMAVSIEMGVGVGSIVLGQVTQFVGFSGMYITAAAIITAGIIAFFALERSFNPAATNGEIRMRLSE